MDEKSVILLISILIVLLVIPVILMIIMAVKKAKKENSTTNPSHRKAGTKGNGEINGQSYFWRQSGPAQNKNPFFTLSLPSRIQGRFTLRKENAFDRLGKRLNLVHEIATNDDTFDARFFIDSAHPEFCRMLLSHSSVRTMVSHLFERGFTRISLGKKALTLQWMPYRPKHNAVAMEEIPDLVTELIEILKTCERTQLIDDDIRNQRTWKQKLSSLYTFSGLVLLVGLISLIWGLVAYTPLDPGEVFVFALKYSMGGFLFFLLTSYYALRGNSAAHGHLLGLFFLGLSGFMLLGFGGTAFLNGRLDHSMPVPHSALVVNKYITKSKNDRDYHLVMESWRTGRETETKEVSKRVYERVTPYDSRMEVVTRTGRFDFEWMVSCRPEEIEPPSGT